MQIQFVGETSTELLELSGVQFERLKRYASNFVFEEKICNFLNEKNYKPLSFKHNGFDMLVNMFLSLDPLHLRSFINYIENKEVLLYENRSGNIIQKCIDNGLNEVFVNKLLNTTAIDQKGNAIGPGEILFSLIFSDLKNSDTDSDLLFNDVHIEVKCRQARFGDRPSKSNQMSISEFVHKLFNVNSIETYERQYGDLKNLCVHLKNGYEAHYSKFEYFLTVCDTLDDIYGRGNKISKLFLQEEDIISVNLKNKLAKIYIYGKILSKNIAHVLFINDRNDYLFAERYDILKDDGLVDINMLSIGEFKFNDLYPQVTLNNVDAIVQ